MCLCNVAGESDCLAAADPNTHYIYPGQTIPLSVAVVGQDFGTIAGPVFAQFMETSSSTASVELESEQAISARGSAK